MSQNNLKGMPKWRTPSVEPVAARHKGKPTVHYWSTTGVFKSRRFQRFGQLEKFVLGLPYGTRVRVSWNGEHRTFIAGAPTKETANVE